MVSDSFSSSNTSPWTCLFILGARPQFIKAAPLHLALTQAGYDVQLVHTGQHFDHNMSAIFFEQLHLPTPHFHLGISGGNHTQMVARMMLELDRIFTQTHPDLVIVFGDTNSTLAGSLSAAQHHIPLIHIEAGLRSHRWEMPEEKNRKLTDHLSQVLFCPTHKAVQLLAQEGITQNVHWVGDVMYDLALQVEMDLSYLDTLNLEKKGYSVLTLHRAEAFKTVESFTEKLEWLKSKAKQTSLIWPIHPRAKHFITHHQLDVGQIHLIDPIGYVEMATLIAHAHEVFTDSGGVQREAYFHKVPCTTLRDESEWPETVESGWNRLWPDRDLPFRSLDQRREVQEFGEGDACLKIVEILTQFLQG